MNTCLLVVLLISPQKNIVLKTFCDGWLRTRPAYRLPLDEFTMGIYYNKRFSMTEKQEIWQMRKKHQLSGVPGDVNRDGICNFVDYAILLRQGCLK